MDADSIHSLVMVALTTRFGIGVFVALFHLSNIFCTIRFRTCIIIIIIIIIITTSGLFRIILHVGMYWFPSTVLLKASFVAFYF